MIPGKPYYNWTTFERGFDIPEAVKEATQVGFRLPRCDLCDDFPEKLEIGKLVREWSNSWGHIVQIQHLETEVRIECHGRRWSLQGTQASQYLAALFESN